MKLHPLLPAGVGFGLLFAVAVLSAVLAVRQSAQVLAVVAALGGFAAPVLASTGSNQPLGLFGYLLVINLGIALIAWFRAWRLLNLIGFVATFALASGWARQYYEPGQFAVAQTFLLIFFLLFTAIGLLFARCTLADAPEADSAPLAARAWQTLQRVGRVGSTLVFGVPMAAFGMQYLLVQPWEYGAAFAALGYGLFYVLLGRLVFATQPRGLALLAEAYAVVGVIFGTLAIPLGLEGQWTGAAWAVEAAGMYWLGTRQARPYARAFALLVLAGAVFKLLQATSIVALPDGPLLAGSFIGPLLVAVASLAVWLLQRRAGLDRPTAPSLQWEMLASHALPWLGMGALTLLPWQWWTPSWAAAATAVLGLMAWLAARRWHLGETFSATGYGLQALALGSFLATLHRAEGGQVLAGGWPGMAQALLIAGSLMTTAVLAMRRVAKTAQARDVAPNWDWAQVLTVLAGTSLLHLAMLFQVSLAQAALIWPLTALAVLWAALRLQHGPLALLAAVLPVVAALVQPGSWTTESLAPFGHLGFWVPVVLGLSALVAADWLRRETARPRPHGHGRFGLSAIGRPWVRWTPVLWGLGWWLLAMLDESARVLRQQGWADHVPAAWLGVLLLTSAAAALLAVRRNWRELGLSTLGTVPAFVLVAAIAWFGTWGVPLLWPVLLFLGEPLPAVYVPSAALGWLAWTLAALWHLRLLRTQERWLAPAALAALHAAGFWLFLLLAMRQGQWLSGQWGEPGSSWRWLGWAVVPAVALWLLRSPALGRRWPLAAFNHAYLGVAALPVALGLLVWLWLGNVVSAGDAAPLPYVPLLNPLELGQWLVLAGLVLWWRTAPLGRADSELASAGTVIAAVTALALLTGLVLRVCHHYAGVPWDFDALYASTLAQAALSITWALCGVAAMVAGHRRVRRVLWMAGAALLAVVVLKLFFVELADSGGLFRIVSFIGVGALLLLVGYFAPVPPARAAEARQDDPASPPQPAGGAHP
ncbi:MAG: hypothetical protein GAK30_00161 [Paracidovorax wautersii]|uniref:DUF2339 domain-containing protein n=1 Tax=Paracidovorax wautersii TaxID=1177982 RepID=A0A7V8JS40_9BURK|nr:MAG: hypothetical protein GAK30_00161 [Paracidovorax wautersii]